MYTTRPVTSPPLRGIEPLQPSIADEVSAGTKPHTVGETALPDRSAPSAGLVKEVLLVIGPGHSEFGRALEDFKEAAPGIKLRVVGDGRSRVTLSMIARTARQLESPSLTPVIVWAHGSKDDGHKVDLGRNIASSELVGVAVKVGLSKLTFYSCHSREAAYEIANDSSLMAPDVIVRLQGGGRESAVGDNQTSIREQLGYYNHCLETGRTPSDVEQYLSALYGSSQCVSFVVPEKNSSGGSAVGRVIHFHKAQPEQMGADEVSSRIGRLTLTGPDEEEIDSEALKNILVAAVERSLNESEQVAHLNAALAREADWGKLEKVQALLAVRADVDGRLADGATPLMFAAGKGHLDVVSALLKKNADVNLAKKSGGTPLIFAVQEGHFAVVKALLRAGADIDQATESGRTPLCAAAEAGHVELVELLLDAGADIDRTTKNGVTPLWAAAQEGHLEVVEMLLDENADVDPATTDGATPLWIAAASGHVGVVEALLKANADVNAAVDGATSLFVAAHEGHLQVVEALLDANADVNKQNQAGHTPLEIAAQKGHGEVVSALMIAGANV